MSARACLAVPRIRETAVRLAVQERCNALYLSQRQTDQAVCKAMGALWIHGVADRAIAVGYLLAARSSNERPTTTLRLAQLGWCWLHSMFVHRIVTRASEPVPNDARRLTDFRTRWSVIRALRK